MQLHQRLRDSFVGTVSLTLIVSGLLAGCADIPTSGPINEGEQVRAPVDEPLVRVIPRPPAQGLKRDEVVSRFLAASASFEGEHGVARQYLTPEAAEQWVPAARVLVYADDDALSVVGKGRKVNVSGRQVATISGHGALTPRARDAFTESFTVQRVGDEWRIAELPQGLLLSVTDVDSLFRSYSLNFLAPGMDRLVPDPVFVPVGQQGLATSLVRLLLDGPTRWLAPAVETAVPAGTQLEVDSVPIENGVAQVDLSANALEADDETLRRFVAQLVWTLTELPEVTGVSITVESTPLQIGSTPLPEQTEDDWTEFDPNYLPEAATPVVMRAGAVMRIIDSRVQPVPGRFGTGQLSLISPATSPDGLLLAALSQSGQQAYLQEGLTDPSVDLVASGSNFSRPSFDANGALWLVDRVGGSRDGSVLWRRDPAGELVKVRCPELRQRAVEQLRISLDGTRAAVVVEGRDGQGTLKLGRVVRTEDRVSVQALRPLGEVIDDVHDVTWSSASTLIALGHDRGSVRGPFQVGTNGVVEEVGGTPVQGMNSVTSAPGFALLATSRGSNQVWQNVGSSWDELVRGSDPAYPG